MNILDITPKQPIDMKTNYATPSIEVIEIEIEDAILGASELTTDVSNNGLQDYNDYEMAW